MLKYDSEDYSLTFHREYHKLVNKYNEAFENWFERYEKYCIPWDYIEECFKQDYLGYFGGLEFLDEFGSKYPKYCENGHVYQMKTFYDMEFDRG